MSKQRGELVEIHRTKQDFILGVPNKFYEYAPAKIRIKRLKDQFVYIPGKYTFFRGTFLTTEELQSIINKLKELNKNG